MYRCLTAWTLSYQDAQEARAELEPDRLTRDPHDPPGSYPDRQIVKLQLQSAMQLPQLPPGKAKDPISKGHLQKTKKEISHGNGQQK